MIVKLDLPEYVTTSKLIDYLRISKMTLIRWEKESNFCAFDRTTRNEKIYRTKDIEVYLQGFNNG